MDRPNSDDPLPIQFVIFPLSDGVILASCPRTPYTPLWFWDKKGTRFSSEEKLIEALDSIGVPGKEIVAQNSGKTFSVTPSQLQKLRAA